MKRRIFFTLIELLVVIAIIAILASLLLPGLRKARETSQQIACSGNMKQCGVAMQSYLNDSNGWFPPASTWPGSVPIWSMKIQSLGYAGTSCDYGTQPSMVFLCPSDSAGKAKPASERLYYCYGYNAYALGMDQSWGPVWSCNLSRIRKFSEVICFADSTKADTVNSGYYVIYPRWAPAQTSLSVFKRHNKGSNIFFLDGHVTWYPGKDVDQINTATANTAWREMWGPYEGI